jgi:hypothetical protein
MTPEDTSRIIAAIDRNTRVRHWQPDGRYPGYETRINEHGYRETRQMKIPDGVPSGYERQMVQVWKGPKDIVIIGTPDESEDEETGHNCDAMGCGWDHVLWRITLTLAFCCILPAAPLMPPLDQPIIVEIGTPPLPPPNPHVQYWYTQWVPTDSGVYPQEVYAPALPKVEPMLYVFTDIGDPPRLVETPEPGTWWLVGGAVVLAAVVAWIARPLSQSGLAQMRACRMARRWFNTTCKPTAYRHIFQSGKVDLPPDGLSPVAKAFIEKLTAMREQERTEYVRRFNEWNPGDGLDEIARTQG